MPGVEERGKNDTREGVHIPSAKYTKYATRGTGHWHKFLVSHTKKCALFVSMDNSNEISPFKNISIHLFLYKKLRIWVSAESFLKSSDLENSEFLTSFLKVP